ncbi:hypothetical protein WME77_36820 [Sorangium sp. So ce764]|uniref:hypothetical protein n=1 Tax=Sorangium sp. So ce764 TaxID=3133320 RepID=UPI003F5FFD37
MIREDDGAWPLACSPASSSSAGSVADRAAAAGVEEDTSELAIALGLYMAPE